MIDPVQWLPDWQRQAPTLPARRAYVVQELQRLASAGLPVLRAVLTADSTAQQLALSILHNEGDVLGVFGQAPEWLLRLVPGAAPPALDPNGRPLPEHERGEVLVAKVGNWGGALTGEKSEDLAGEVVVQFGADARQAFRDNGGAIYRTLKIGRAPVRAQLRDAISVMRAWGHGVRPVAGRYAAMGDNPRQDRWLVEEVTRAQLDAERERQPPPPAKGDGKRAT